MAVATETNQLPWEVKRVRRSKRSLLSVSGFNHYTGEDFHWEIDHHSFRDPEFAARRYDFSGAEFEGNTREVLARVWPSCPAVGC